MKKALLLIIAALGAWIYFRDPQATHLNKENISPTPSKYKTIAWNEGIYGYEVEIIKNPSLLKLIPNYNEKIAVDQLVQDHSCSQAINGGFYSEANRPLGLLVANGQEFSKSIKSSLFNGYFSVNKQGEVLIDNLEYFDTNIALQTGPLLVLDNQFRDLILTDDKTSRRMVVAISIPEQLLFITVFNPQAEVLGPRLDDLPLILQEISKQEGFKLDSAINLDGGRASAFRSDSLQLSELTWVGSLLCVGAPNESI